MAGNFSRCYLLLIAIFIIALMAAPVSACPFCTMAGQTLTSEANQASMVLFGTLTNAKLNLGAGGLEQGSTDFEIEAIVKKHDILGDKKVITLPRYVPTNKNSGKFLFFCDVFKGKIDPLRVIQVKSDSDIVKYLQGALAVKDKDTPTRLKFFFDYLDNGDLEIANDSYKEFANADYKETRQVAKQCSPDKLAKWLQDPDTPAFRHGLYALMLGDCGGDKHAEVLHRMLDDAQKQATTGVDGLLTAYTMLKPKEGWVYLSDILQDPKKEFMLRYAALRAIRFLWSYRPELVPEKNRVEGLTILLDQGDIADLAIEDLRLHACWEVTERVLALYDKKSHDVPIIRRYIVRYAVSCPKPQAAEFVAKVRKKEPDMVKDIEEFLKLETPAVPPATTSRPASKPLAGK